MDKSKQVALARALEQIKSGSTMVVKVKMQGESDHPPPPLRNELEAIIGKPVSIVWQKITKREILRTNNGVITDGLSAEQRYYEEAARRGARTGD